MLVFASPLGAMEEAAGAAGVEGAREWPGAAAPDERCGGAARTLASTVVDELHCVDGWAAAGEVDVRRVSTTCDCVVFARSGPSEDVMVALCGVRAAAAVGSHAWCRHSVALEVEPAEVRAFVRVCVWGGCRWRG